MSRLILVLSLFALMASPVLAVEPDEVLKDPALESRARALSKELRCLVCQNQSIDDSNADLARDLRVVVRERLVAGDSDDQVMAYVTARYGDFVLLRPPIKPVTYVLWFGPAIVFVVGLGGLVVFFRRRARAPVLAAPLSDDERRRLDRLLEDRPEP